MPGTPDGRSRTRWNDKELDSSSVSERTNNLSRLAVCSHSEGWSSRSLAVFKPSGDKPGIGGSDTVGMESNLMTSPPSCRVL